jgi:hypothetical protein
MIAGAFAQLPDNLKRLARSAVTALWSRDHRSCDARAAANARSEATKHTALIVGFTASMRRSIACIISTGESACDRYLPSISSADK